MAFLGLFRLFGPFRPFLAYPGIPAKGGFTSTPRGGALSRLFRGFLVPGPGRPGEGHFGPFFPKIPEKGDFRGPGPGGVQTTQPGDRAPARGVDVKPPSPERSARGTPGSRAREGHIPDPGDREPCWEPWRPLPGAWEPLPAVPRGLLLHQPLAAGPCGPSGTPEVAAGPCPRLGRLVAPTPAPYRGGGTGRRVRGGCGRRSALVWCEENSKGLLSHLDFGLVSNPVV